MVLRKTYLLNKYFLLIFLGTIALYCFIFLPFAQADPPSSRDEAICAAYITGIGCGNCAVSDPYIFTELIQKYPQLIIIEYEIYKSREENKFVKDGYFANYIKEGQRAGVPFFIFDSRHNAIGRYEVLDVAKRIHDLSSNPCPLANGKSQDFESLDIRTLPGQYNIWTKNRVLLSADGGDKSILKRILLKRDISSALEGVHFQKVDPVPVEISQGKIHFDYAVTIGDWRLQWNGEPLKVRKSFRLGDDAMTWIFISIIFLLAVFFFFKIEKREKTMAITFRFQRKKKEVIIVLISLLAILAFLLLTKNVNPDYLKKMGYQLPLPVFTVFIALVDGFNPCNMFVLTCLLALLISSSDSKARLFAVAISFVVVVYIIYFLFMTAWLNIFKYFSFVAPLRIGIAILALAAGIINCKELLFFKKGISLTIQDKHKDTLMGRMRGMKKIIQNGSFPILITSSIGLATLASLVELPCTAGFPIVYTGILSGKILNSTLAYYLYLAFYNLIYVIPLLVIITIFINTFHAKAISERQVQIIKFIGGVIMLLLGIVLLVNPGLIGLGFG